MEDADFSTIGTRTQIAVLGAGSWGTALAALLAANGHTIHLWAREPELIAALLDDRENARYLPGIHLPPAVTPSADLRDALSGVGVVVFAVPSGAVREVAQKSVWLMPSDALLLSAAKGLEDNTGLRMSQVLAEVIPGSYHRIVSLSGPNLAVEVAKGAPTASVAASANPAAALAAQRLFTGQTNPTFRVYTARDVIGVELGGAIKNVIAIFAGVSDGMGLGDNSKAALMTRGLNEAIHVGVAQGAEAQTFLGLSGVGDLIATGTSKLSRNYRVGYALGQGRSLATVLAELGQVAEGVPTTSVLCKLARQSNVEAPLFSALRSMIVDNRSASDVMRELMLRPPKEERLALGELR